MMVKFSFLIPLYNGEQYIAQCLDSLLNQDISCECYEIICLDDCSSDNSCDVIRKYQQHYPNIKLYKNEKNSRVATNVNRLVQLASGKYFWLIGQDDYIKPNCLGMLWNKLEADNLDVLVFNYRRVNQNEELIEDIREVDNTQKMTGVEWIVNQYESKDRNYCYYILGYEWRAVYKTEHWRNKHIKCVDGLNWEDTVIMMKAIVYSNSVASNSDILYNYRQHIGSISSSVNHVKKGNYIFEFSFQVGDEVEQFFNELLILAPQLVLNMKKQVQWRYNCFAFDLIRTNHEQMKLFYITVKQYKSLLQSKKHWLNWKSRALLTAIGYPMARLCGAVYRLKKLLI